MFKVKVIGQDLYYTVYGVREKDGKTEFLLHEAFWYWDDADSYSPIEQ